MGMTELEDGEFSLVMDQKTYEDGYRDSGLVPTGRYAAEITRSRVVQFDSGNRALRTTYTLRDCLALDEESDAADDAIDREISDTIFLDIKNSFNWKLLRILSEAAGVNFATEDVEGKQVVNGNAHDFEGCWVELTVWHKSEKQEDGSTKGPFNRVRNLTPYKPKAAEERASNGGAQAKPQQQAQAVAPTTPPAEVAPPTPPAPPPPAARGRRGL